MELSLLLSIWGGGGAGGGGASHLNVNLDAEGSQEGTAQYHRLHRQGLDTFQVGTPTFAGKLLNCHLKSRSTILRNKNLLIALHLTPMTGICLHTAFRLSAHYLEGTHGNSENTSAQVEQDSSGKDGSPLLVFINWGSGGHVGEQLSEYFKEALGRAQVR